MKKAIKVITIAAALATVIPNVNSAPYTGLGGCNMQIYKVLAERYKHYNDKKFSIQVQEDVEHQMSKHYRGTLQGLDLTPALKQGFVEDYMELPHTKAIVKVFMSCTLAERKKLKVEKLLLTVTNNLNRRK